MKRSRTNSNRTGHTNKKTKRVTNKAYFVYGRFNPPTKGHKAMIDDMIDLAGSNNATPYIIVSHSLNAKNNPLEPKDKIKILEKLYPNVEIHQTKNNPILGTSVLSVVLYLIGENKKNITMVVGSNRKSPSPPSNNILSETNRIIAEASATKLRKAARADLGNNNKIKNEHIVTFKKYFINDDFTDDEIKILMTTIKNRLTKNPSKKKNSGRGFGWIRGWLAKHKNKYGNITFNNISVGKTRI